jgi:Ca2+-binding EF-hand superfamily protein
MDNNNSGRLEKPEFFKALNDYRISSDAKELEAIFKIFDTDNSGGIDYNEFICQIVGKMNVRRESIATRAFTVMDLNGNGSL